MVDLDGDGAREVVFGTAMGGVYVLAAADGSVAAGWPVQLDGAVLGDVVAEDVDADGALEVLCVCMRTRACVYVCVCTCALLALWMPRLCVRVPRILLCVLACSRFRVIVRVCVHTRVRVCACAWKTPACCARQIIASDERGNLAVLGAGGDVRWHRRLSSAVHARVAVGDVNGDGAV